MCILFEGDGMNRSIWTNDAAISSFPALEGDGKVDVLIIGGGMAGLLCARRLTQEGVSCIVLESDHICAGATCNTTAKITSQHGLIYAKLLSKFGREAARLYWEANEAALKEYQKMAAIIPCDFEEKSHYVYSSHSSITLEKEAETLEQLGIPYSWTDNLTLPIPVKSAIGFRKQAQFHPLKFATGICKDLPILENTAAREFIGNTVVTDRGRITASKIIVATHFPILNKHGAYFLKMHQQRSYVVAVDNAMEVDGMYLSAEDSGFSFRNYGSALLVGSSSHRTGKKSVGWKALEAFTQEKFPKRRISYRWANQDCMTLDGMPYIGRYGAGTKDMYVATGFNKWGMTGSMVSAMILTDLILERENQYADLFSPQRSMLHPQLACNALEATVNLIRPKGPRCPHLHCCLKWNPWEHSWDCPCHGSRFEENGKLLNNPATDNLPE